jgi:hypothetical protein
VDPRGADRLARRTRPGPHLRALDAWLLARAAADLSPSNASTPTCAPPAAPASPSRARAEPSRPRASSAHAHLGYHPPMLLRSAPLALLLLAVACDKPQNSGQPPNGGPACTTEAKMCPDGSGVGRTGPNCEYAPCPSGQEAPQQACTREAKVCPDGSAVGRTGPNCEFSPCPAN